MKTPIDDGEPRIVQGARKYFKQTRLSRSKPARSGSPDPSAEPGLANPFRAILDLRRLTVLATHDGATSLSIAHGGRIWAQNRVAQGRTFAFVLPAAG